MKNSSALLLPVLVLGAQGCAPVVSSTFDSLASHTVQIASDQSADVVWIRKRTVTDGKVDEALFRCHNSPQGPVCKAVRAQ